MSAAIKVAFATGTEELIPRLIQEMKALGPDVPLYVVAEFPVEGAHWVPYHLARGFSENLALCRWAFAGKRIVLAGLVLQPSTPYWKMRALALLLAPWRTVFFNEQLDHFMLRPRSTGVLLRHLFWRVRNLVRFQLRPNGDVHTLLSRLAHPSSLLPLWRYTLAQWAGLRARWRKAAISPAADPEPGPALAEGISVVVPSRDGKDLLARLLPGLLRELNGIPSEVIVVDNGSSDGTAQFLAGEFPGVAAAEGAAPLSFARAVNAGIRLARYSRVCLLNNDMVLEPGFFPPLLEAFRGVPELFCATAQIYFPEGERRQETGKAVMPAKLPNDKGLDFPVRCDVPIEGENLSYVLYGSGGCSLYDTRKLRQIGCFREVYEPAYVEDLDAGYRAWLRGWPTVFVSGARVVHRHRATTSRYYSEEELERILEINWLRFLASCVGSPELFASLWGQAVGRLKALASRTPPRSSALEGLRSARLAPRWVEPSPRNAADDSRVLAIGSGDVAVFPGRARSGKPLVLVASPYLPFPLAHGGAVRMYNLMRRASANYDQVLVSFAPVPGPVPPELLDICVEIVQVKLHGSHLRASTERPDVVEEFDSAAFRAALGETLRKWSPAIAQLEFTQMAQYASACRPARTILVEHDVTFDLHRQLLACQDDWETRRQYTRWLTFEKAAWDQVDRIVVMSEKDRRATCKPAAVTLPNGVDLERFRPATAEPEPRRLLFIGSFGHLPNVLAIDFFLRQVWPRLRRLEPVLHVIAGARRRYFLDRYKDRVEPPLNQDGLEVEDFVADPRPAYARAAVVIAPLRASAGTNIKIMEAMAMGKAVVSTPAGINGLDELEPGRDLLVGESGPELAAAIERLFLDPALRRGIELQASQTAERHYNWDVIAARQDQLYRSLIAAQ